MTSQATATTISTLLDEAVALLRARGARTIIGITGPPGAGKSLLAQALAAAAGPRTGEAATALPMDGFHFSNARLDALGLRARKGAPETFDACGFVTALAKLAEGKMVSWPEYSRVLHEPLADSLTIPASTRLIFLEGNYLALDKTPWDRVPALLACLWYVDADLSSLRERLLSRQVDGGRAAADAIRHVEDVDVRNIMIVERCRDRATRVVRINPDDPLSYGVIDPATGKPFDLSR